VQALNDGGNIGIDNVKSAEVMETIHALYRQDVLVLES